MKIDYEYESYPYHLELSKINIFFGGTSSGKSAMADFFNKSFTGQNKMFMIEHQNVSKSDFEVTYISGNANLNDEIKLSSKTLLSKIIKEVLNDLDDQLLEKIKDNIKNEMLPITNEIKLKLNCITDDQYDSDLYVDDLMKLLKIYYVFFEEGNILSSSKSRFLTLSLTTLLNKEKKRNIIIIDDFDLYLDLSQMLLLIEKFNNNQDCVYFLFVRSVELCNILIHQHKIFLINKNMADLEKYFLKLTNDLINQSKLDYYPILVDDEVKLLNYSLKTYYLKEILHVISSKYPKLIIENLRKSDFYSIEFIELLEKI
ncbi:hypothetical protein [Traorella massiliensis]|uniref:hypothetical protein n=1 Tax=Traorella massiliensis TaxID=1903263 RepID=UPI00248D8AF4|nr:hypothetical protein [Traorella massiliensis]